jgi:hypothetical protein
LLQVGDLFELNINLQCQKVNLSGHYDAVDFSAVQEIRNLL